MSKMTIIGLCVIVLSGFSFLIPVDGEGPPSQVSAVKTTQSTSSIAVIAPDGYYMGARTYNPVDEKLEEGGEKK